MWSGTREDIPDGWVLCDGDNGTPDLGNRFVRSVGVSYEPHEIGGTNWHTHDGDVDQAQDELDSGDEVIKCYPNGQYAALTKGHTHHYVTSRFYHSPIFYTLCFIMKL